MKFISYYKNKKSINEIRNIFAGDTVTNKPDLSSDEVLMISFTLWKRSIGKHRSEMNDNIYTMGRYFNITEMMHLLVKYHLDNIKDNIKYSPISTNAETMIIDGTLTKNIINVLPDTDYRNMFDDDSNISFTKYINDIFGCDITVDCMIKFYTDIMEILIGDMFKQKKLTNILQIRQGNKSGGTSNMYRYPNNWYKGMDGRINNIFFDNTTLSEMSRLL